MVRILMKHQLPGTSLGVRPPGWRCGFTIHACLTVGPVFWDRIFPGGFPTWNSHIHDHHYDQPPHWDIPTATPDQVLDSEPPVEAQSAQLKRFHDVHDFCIAVYWSYTKVLAKDFISPCQDVGNFSSAFFLLCEDLFIPLDPQMSPRNASVAHEQTHLAVATVAMIPWWEGKIKPAFWVIPPGK